VKRFILAAVATVLVFAGAVVLEEPVSAQTTSDTIKQINTECNAIQDAILALHPIHVAFRSGKWDVLSDADYTVAMQTKASITFADVYRQGSKYAWVHAHSFDSQGNQRATQLCFRQSNGTLERARQATTVPDLAADSAQQAYFLSNGTLIQKSSLFEMNDPLLAKTIQSLPFYSVLPK